jgi:hypothetical protein
MGSSIDEGAQRYRSRFVRGHKGRMAWTISPNSSATSAASRSAPAATPDNSSICPPRRTARSRKSLKAFCGVPPAARSSAAVRPGPLPGRFPVSATIQTGSIKMRGLDRAVGKRTFLIRLPSGPDLVRSAVFVGLRQCRHGVDRIRPAACSLSDRPQFAGGEIALGKRGGAILQVT